MVILTMLAVIVVALGVLGAVAAMHFAAVRRQVRSTPGGMVQLETAARIARRQMNRAAGQSWRNIVD